MELLLVSKSVKIRVGGNQFQPPKNLPSRHTTPYIKYNNFHITQPYNFNGFNLRVSKYTNLVQGQHTQQRSLNPLGT